MSVQVWIIMWSSSDLPAMQDALDILEEFGVSYEYKVVSAHRTPELMVEYAKNAQSKWLQIIIAGAGGAAHLPGMTASLTNIPVIWVPVKSSTMSWLDSLYSIVQMPRWVPVATMAINGSKNAGLFAIKTLALHDSSLQEKLDVYTQEMKDKVKQMNEDIKKET